MRKYDFISILAQETAKEIVRNRNAWMQYLTTAARLYKYPFREQILIYAQRPDATACASIDVWNERMHCWVNKGAKGIALIDEDNAHGKRLKYVFDVSDVHAARRIGRYPEKWEVHEEHKDAVIDRLEQIYGGTDERSPFEERLIEISRRIAEDCYEELLPDLQYLTEGSFLDGLDEQNVGIRLRETLAEIVAMHKQGAYDLPEVEEKETQAVQKNLTPWERVQLSRDKARPVGAEYIEELFTDFMEFHGDRYYQDDKAIIGGIARFHGMPVTVIAQAKGRTTKENIERNFGMPSPDGYRKALRLMKQAEKFNRPVICFVDTPGAFCGLEAEERGQGEAIARNLFEMSNLQVPILSVVIGEGGSGGALAMATSDEVWLLENSIYSILSPEGFASILWKDSSRAKEAAGVMKLTADQLLKAGIVERVISEPEDFNLETFTEVTDPMDDYICIFLKKYGAMTKEELTEKRYDRFRRM